jgi:hypothetical protein
LLGASCLIALICAFVMALVPFLNLASVAFRRGLREAAPLAVLIVCGWLLTWRPRSILLLPVRPDLWQRLDEGARWLLQGRLFKALAALGLAMLVTWLPHYLRWPWWTDMDHFAVTALSWDRGVLPYRDLLDFNFPGPVYLFWLLGKLFGWGKTLPYYALDALLLIALGAALLSWSGRRLGNSLPGLAGYFVFLVYYLRLDFSQVAQRDWQSPLFAVLGLFALEVLPDRKARALSAVAFALALVFRPHAVLIAPAFVSAIDENARGPGDGPRRTLVALAEWSLFVLVGALFAFAPVLYAGIADDLVTSFHSAWYGGSYNHASQSKGLDLLLRDLLCWETLGVLTVLLALSLQAGSPVARTARTWALAIVFLLLYKPLSPVAFLYHHHPLKLATSVGLAIVISAVIAAPNLVPSLRCAALMVLVASHLAGFPTNCSVFRTARAIRGIVLGTPPTLAPLGCARDLPNRESRSAYHSWEDYAAVLQYLRETTNPRTRVANFIRYPPCPPVNGPTGRLTTFPCAEGTQWLRWVAPELEGRFASSLLEHEDSVVVWDPKAPGFPLLERTIREHYRPEAQFGSLEVWRREPGPDPDQRWD